MPWIQVYDPLHGPWLSTAAAALPIVLLLVALAVFEWRAHRAALLGLVSGLAVSIFVFGMPVPAALATAAYGAAYGFLPIGWIVLNAVFLYSLTVATGQFDVVKGSVGRLSSDRRIQALLVAFSFGAFIEGASGFGTPVAICSALLIGLGFTPLYAAGLSLIANTAPVAFGAIGTPILTLGAVTGIPAKTLGMMAGRQLPFVSLIVPAWLVVTMSGWRGLRSVWPAVLVCGGTFAVVQFAWSNLVGPELVDIAGGLVSIAALAAFCRVWRPRDEWSDVAAPMVSSRLGLASAPAPVHGEPSLRRDTRARKNRRARVGAMDFLEHRRDHLGARAGESLPQPGRARARLQGADAAPHGVPRLSGCHRARGSGADRRRALPERARRAGAVHRQLGIGHGNGDPAVRGPVGALPARVARQFFAVAGQTLLRMRAPLATIMLMLALGFVTRYGGTDATLGLAFTRTGWLYPFFATLLGWLGVALTGSDTSSNVLFGSLQKITAQQLGFNPVLITTANSTGGVMGKMIDAQSIVVATASTGQTGQEGRILRFVFWHSVALAAIMGIIVMLQAYVFPWMIPG